MFVFPNFKLVLFQNLPIFLVKWGGILFFIRSQSKLTNTIHLTLKMTSAQIVETSVTNNSSFQNYTHPDDHTIRTTDTPGFKPFSMLVIFLTGWYREGTGNPSGWSHSVHATVGQVWFRNYWGENNQTTLWVLLPFLWVSFGFVSFFIVIGCYERHCLIMYFVFLLIYRISLR